MADARIEGGIDVSREGAEEPVDDAGATHRVYRASGAGESLKNRWRFSAQASWHAVSFSAAMPRRWQRARADANGSARDAIGDVSEGCVGPWR